MKYSRRRIRKRDRFSRYISFWTILIRRAIWWEANHWKEAVLFSTLSLISRSPSKFSQRLDDYYFFSSQIYFTRDRWWGKEQSLLWRLIYFMNVVLFEHIEVGAMSASYSQENDEWTFLSSLCWCWWKISRTRLPCGLGWRLRRRWVQVHIEKGDESTGHGHTCCVCNEILIVVI